MNQELWRTCTTIVLLIKPFVWRRCHCRCRRGYLKLPIVRWETGKAFYVIGWKSIRIHPSTRYRTRCGYTFFHSGERIYFFSGFAVECAAYVWTVAVSGKKKLWIKKYLDMCGRGLILGHSNYVRIQILPLRCSWISNDVRPFYAMFWTLPKVASYYAY